VLYGQVDEIKRNFAGHAVVVEGEGDFSGVPDVLEARQENGAWHLALAPGVDPHDILRTLVVRQDLRVERFEIAEASLDDIFVAVVEQGRNGAFPQA
jgi:ABC-type uncharacterized transport system ATPase subunit